MQAQTIKSRPKTGGFASAMPKVKGVAERVNEITATDSPTMRAARTRAQQFANQRGFGNSSFAAGAAELAAIESALPMASQDSAQDNQKALSRQGFLQQTKLQDDSQKFAAGESALDRGLTREQADAERLFRTSEREGAQEFASSESAIDRAFRSAEAATSRDFEGGQREMDRELSTSLQEMAQEFNSSEAAIARNFELTRLAETQDFQADQAELERVSRETIAGWNLDASDRAGAAQFVANSQATHAQAYSSVLQNPEISAKARQQQLIQLRRENIKRLNLGQQLYGIKLEF